MRLSSFFLLTVLLTVASPLRAGDSVLLGYWQTEDKDAVVEFFKCEDSYCGRFVWLKDDSPDEPSLDERNKDQSKRARPLCGLTFLGGFHEIEKGVYGSGWVYSPRHGHDYSAELFPKGNDVLVLRGYVFIPFLGGSQTWHRVQKPAFCWALMGE